MALEGKQEMVEYVPIMRKVPSINECVIYTYFELWYSNIRAI